MKIEQFEQKQSEMSDNELADLCQKQILELCKTGGKSLIMSVPPRVNDTDMLFCELIKRFKTLSNLK